MWELALSFNLFITFLSSCASPRRDSLSKPRSRQAVIHAGWQNEDAPAPASRTPQTRHRPCRAHRKRHAPAMQDAVVARHAGRARDQGSEPHPEAELCTARRERGAAGAGRPGTGHLGGVAMRARCDRSLRRAIRTAAAACRGDGVRQQGARRLWRHTVCGSHPLPIGRGHPVVCGGSHARGHSRRFCARGHRARSAQEVSAACTCLKTGYSCAGMGVRTRRRGGARTRGFHRLHGDGKTRGGSHARRGRPQPGRVAQSCGGNGLQRRKGAGDCVGPIIIDQVHLSDGCASALAGGRAVCDAPVLSPPQMNSQQLQCQLPYAWRGDADAPGGGMEFMLEYAPPDMRFASSIDLRGCRALKKLRHVAACPNHLQRFKTNGTCTAHTRHPRLRSKRAD